jgi:hypothetical protein
LVEANEIGQVLSSNEPAAAVHRLVDMARARGGHDNITVVALKVPTTPISQKESGCLRQAVLAAALGLVTLAAALLISWRLNVWPWNTGFLSGILGSEAITTPIPSASQPATEPAFAPGTITTSPTPTPTSGPTSTPIPLDTVQPGAGS